MATLAMPTPENRTVGGQDGWMIPAACAAPEIDSKRLQHSPEADPQDSVLALSIFDHNLSIRLSVFDDARVAVKNGLASNDSMRGYEIVR
jgi:hypothetical protein